MYSYLLQDWITVNVDTSQTQMIQSESDWMSFQAFQDIVFWLDVMSSTTDGAATLTVYYETSPTKDPGMFTAMGSVALTGSTNAPTVTPILLNANPSVPLARWVRWRLGLDMASGTNWGACFRIHASANAVGVVG